MESSRELSDKRNRACRVPAPHRAEESGLKLSDICFIMGTAGTQGFVSDSNSWLRSYQPAFHLQPVSALLEAPCASGALLPSPVKSHSPFKTWLKCFFPDTSHTSVLTSLLWVSRLDDTCLLCIPEVCLADSTWAQKLTGACSRNSMEHSPEHEVGSRTFSK